MKMRRPNPLAIYFHLCGPQAKNMFENLEGVNVSNNETIAIHKTGMSRPVRTSRFMYPNLPIHLQQPDFKRAFQNIWTPFEAKIDYISDSNL